MAGALLVAEKRDPQSATSAAFGAQAAADVVAVDRTSAPLCTDPDNTDELASADDVRRHNHQLAETIVERTRQLEVLAGELRIERDALRETFDVELS